MATCGRATSCNAMLARGAWREGGGCVECGLAGQAELSKLLLSQRFPMSRFQALTNTVLDAELEMVRKRLGIESNQKAELLREVTALAAWVVRQSAQGRRVEGRRGRESELLEHPMLEKLRAQRQQSLASQLKLSNDEIVALCAVLDRGFSPTPGLRKAFSNLANPKRRPPQLRWKKSAS